MPARNPWTILWLALAGVIGLAPSLWAQAPSIVHAEIGIGGHYKVGYWTPLRLELGGGEAGLDVRPWVQVPDSDGVTTSIPGSLVHVPAGGRVSTELLVRVGQLTSSVTVELKLENGQPVTRPYQFHPYATSNSSTIADGSAATTQFFVEVGPTSVGIDQQRATQSGELQIAQAIIGRVANAGDLPRHWLAYEGVDTLLLTTSNRPSWQALRRDDPRVRAIAEWVEGGGRVILFCGQNAPELLAPDGPLAELLPGEFDGMATVANMGPLELYSGINEPFPGRGQTQISVPRLRQVRGDVELTLAAEETQLPVVVRARHGLGQVVFVGLDLDQPPMRDWSSRPAVLDKLLNLPDESLGTDQENYYYAGEADLSQTLQERLDATLETSGIRTPPFLMIVGLVVLYILLIGPGDYFLVKHWLKRMEWTWITFPAIVVATCVGAYVLAGRMKGNELRVSQVEVLDVDTTSGLTRGTMWTHVFSPAPDSYTLTLAAQSPSGKAAPTRDTSIAWLGRASDGVGGMNATSSGAGLFAPSYGWSPDRSTLLRLPIEVWSTKTLVTRWKAHSNETVASTLVRAPNNLVEGTLTNQTGVALGDCRLIYRGSAWRLGDLANGTTATIESASRATGERGARRLRTLFSREHKLASDADAYVQHRALRNVDLQGLAEIMMLSEALGGRKLTNKWNRYQHFVDLSRALDGDTAMLIAVGEDPRSELMRLQPGQEAPTSMRGPKDTYRVIYRFLVPVGPAE